MEELEFESHGYKCNILFVNESHYCGYVVIPNTHPAYKEDYYTHSVDIENFKNFTQKDIDTIIDINNIEVHGGVTYADRNIRNLYTNEDVWIFGFDANHSYDKSLKYENAFSDGTFKDLDFMKNECKKLAKQLKDIEVKYNEQI